MHLKVTVVLPRKLYLHQWLAQVLQRQRYDSLLLILHEAVSTEVVMCSVNDDLGYFANYDENSEWQRAPNHVLIDALVVTGIHLMCLLTGLL